MLEFGMCISRSQVCVLAMTLLRARRFLIVLMARSSRTVSCISNPDRAKTFRMTSPIPRRALAALLVLSLFTTCVATASTPTSLRVLFLGDNGHHKPADRFKQIQPVLAGKGIESLYIDDLADLNAGKLAGFDCLV